VSRIDPRIDPGSISRIDPDPSLPNPSLPDTTIHEMPNGSYNAELVKQLSPEMVAELKKRYPAR
jgi:hypothetical protein